MADKGITIQERDTSTPKNYTAVTIYSERTNLTMAGEFHGESVPDNGDAGVIVALQERDSSSPKNYTSVVICATCICGTYGPDQGKTDIFENAISNQRKRGQI